MPNFKKNQINQVIFPMVDKTDFASIESAITASDFNSAATKKIFGVNHGVSDAFTSATISKAATLVHSGIFQQTLKASETNYDYLVVRFTHPSCADQILIFQTAEIDPSDAYSLLSDFFSDFQSRVPKAVATNSQLSDLHSDLRSFLAVMSGVLSDVRSDVSDLHSDVLIMSDILSNAYSALIALSDAVSDMHSDLGSKIGGIAATVTASDMSDIASRVWATAEGTRVDSRILVIQSMVSDADSQILLNASMISDVQSALSDLISNFESRIPEEPAARSQLSDLISDLRSYLVGISGALSDVESQVDLVATSNYLSAVHSDLSSKIGAITATVTASDMSDIASRVWATAEGTRVDSRILVIQSLVSDVDSQLLLNASMISDVQSVLSDFVSNFDSRVPEEPAARSQLSDLVSDLRSYLVGISGSLSDVESQVDLLATSNYLSAVHSDLSSKIGGLTVVVTASDMSDIASRVWATAEGTRVDSRILVIQSLVSDVGSQLLLNASMISDIQSALDSQFVYESNVLSDMQSDLSSKIAGLTVVVTASDMSDIASRVWATAEGIRVDSRILVIQSLVSDVDSQLLINASVISDIQSVLSDYVSNFDSRVPKEPAARSQLSDLASDLRSYLVGLSGSLSDVESQVDLLATSNYLSAVHSDLSSKIGGLTVVVTASDMSDIASRVWATAEGTRVDSRILVIQSLVSDVDSQLLLNASLISDIQSALSDAHSDLKSAIGNVSVTLTPSDISDIASAVAAAIGSSISDIYSLLSDTGSDLRSILLGLSGQLSDVDSQLTVNFEQGSDIYSLLSDAHSDLRSQIGGLTVVVTASDMSDIASRVWATAEGTRVDSRILVIQSLTSDVDSQLLLNASMISDILSALDSQFVYESNALSDMQSDLGSKIGAIVATVTASDMSDIASRVWATAEGTRVDSRILVIQSLVSDVGSQLLLNASVISDIQSALDSQFAYESNALSDIQSDLGSKIGAIVVTVSASDMSDIASRVWATPEGARVDSRILVIQSMVSDVDSQLTVNFDQDSDIYSLLNDVDSQVLLDASVISDLQSALDSQFAYLSNAISDAHSDLKSAVGNVSVALTASDVSDIASAVAAAIGATNFPAGAIEFTYTVTDIVTGNPIEGVEVWISTDLAATNIVWKGDTDAFGIAMDVLGNLPRLDAGTYYFWRQKVGYTFTDPDTEVVS